MQALRAAKNRRHRFHRGAHDVVVRVLFSQAPAAGLAMGAQHQAFGVFGAKTLHHPAPKQPGSAHFGNLQIKVHAHAPEKRQASGKGIHI